MYHNSWLILKEGNFPFVSLYLLCDYLFVFLLPCNISQYILFCAFWWPTALTRLEFCEEVSIDSGCKRRFRENLPSECKIIVNTK